MEILIAIFSGLAVFLTILTISIIITPENVKLEKEKNTTSKKLFKTDPEVLANKLGIQTDKYVFNCNILGVTPKIEQLIISRIFAIILFIIGLILALIIPNNMAKLITALFTIMITVLIFLAPTQTIQSRAKDRQDQFESEIPRFLDLLQTALKIQLPIATAIEITAKNVNGILSEELLKAITISEVGTSNWQDALYDIAQRYEVDSFSDFVLDIVTAFQKGSDIVASVERQSRDIKTSALLKAKESAAKVTSLILLPVVFFKMLPLMLLLFFPVILQLLGM